MTHLKEAQQRGYEVTVPTVVVAEVWRGGSRSARIAALLAACVVEPLQEDLARAAGEALAHVRGAGVIDAIVMGSASRRGDFVLTGDAGDLRRLSACFPRARVVPL
jgi:predicted nucleic acid-binding protein